MIEDETEHFEALQRTGFYGKAGAGCVIVAKDTGRILLPLRSDECEHPGTYGTWGGALNPGDDPETAALREMTEECGYLGAVDLRQLLVFRSGSFTYHNFLAIVDREFCPVLNWETDEAAWVSLDDLPQNLHHGLRAVLADERSLDAIKKR
jgi:8-oxo-dGTP pyrophosphatase MutT (NUDIX family)